MTRTKAAADVRKSLEGKLERLRHDAAELKNLPAARAALDKAREEQAAYLNGPTPRFANTDDRDRRIALSAEVSRTANIARTIESAGTEAQREIVRIELLLGASGDIARLKKEAAVIASDGAIAEKRTLALRAALEAISAQRNQVESRVTTERTEAAERVLNARLEGKSAPALTASSKAAEELASLDAERSVAQRQLTEATEKLRALGEQAQAVRIKLLQAMARASELDWLQALEDIRPTVERHAAITAIAGMGHLYGDALAIPIDEVAVQDLANELEVEYRGWQPATPTAAAMPVAPGPTSSAEPSAQAAA